MGVVTGGGGGGGVQVAKAAKVTISSANLLGIGATALQILASPGAGSAYIVDYAALNYTKGGSSYTGPINFELGNGNGGGSPFVDIVQAELGDGSQQLDTVGTGFYVFVTGRPGNAGPTVNGYSASLMPSVGLYLDNGGNNLTNGNGSGVLYVAYHTITIP